MFDTMDVEKRKTTGLGEVSFSSYRSTAEEIFVHKIAQPRLTRNKSPDGEISVFGAEKYFSTKLDDAEGDGDDKFSNKRDDSLQGPRRWPGTPSASSEASWSSQSVLLRSFMKDRSMNKKKRVDGRSFFANLSCTGSCSNGKSVYVNQDVDRGRVHAKEVSRKSVQPKFSPKDDVDRTNFRSVPIPELETQLDDPRNSLEVFGSTAMKKGDVTKNLQRKLSMLTWDAIPNAPSVSSISRSNRMDDDVDSDCSSDLFEINNIDRDSPYAPSETSVEWSVVTAVAADCSFVSDHNENRSKSITRVANTTKEAQRSRLGGILGCKSHKAVMVVETAYTKGPNIIDS
ncbi:S-adenosyl-L-methionine-dependent methyltransferases superfamily protein [Hibiscus syriacus]|uniref:S-adenosyl-L-methionine-dependent methyltransferases superfamily protein n=1 Tax=Hibiscus syriacus TaxID=106335 RepID=A0A6A3D3R3_HIBSY|nr:protein PHYTOCHROME KINASE SUBSTRATE 3-like [Hibiscus syriacus]KAE8736260.1 S-adenosyl-L-methionine-dependent methyltransferases superfamily protein [Hibiscus syriacus]